MKVLMAGGAGYIGSHTTVEFLSAGHEVVVVDNLSNSKALVIDRIEEITGKRVSFYESDISDYDETLRIFETEAVEAAVHFAGLKAVGESVADPLHYYNTNLGSALSLIRCMRATGARHLVFSSSATVYGDPKTVPIREDAVANKAANPYGRTKIMIETMLQDICAADPGFNAALLRYFNPAGAHPSARIGEDPRGTPNNLVPFITQVAIGMRNELTIHGDDYETPDGSCIRDYIHVQDLARGHVAALEKLSTNSGLVTYNLGTGKGTSVKEVVAAFERATNQHIPNRVGPRRDGDVPSTYTDTARAEKELNWKAKFTIEDICRDAWHWQQENPHGYDD